MLTKRMFLGAAAGLAGAALLGRPLLAEAKESGMLFIDGLGAPQGEDGESTGKWSADRVAEWRKSGMSAWMVDISEPKAGQAAWNKTIANIASYQDLAASNPEIFVQARSAGDIRAARAQGKSALILGTEDTAMMGADLDKVTVLARLGVKVVQLTYNIRNMSGDGALETANGGLTNFGREMIARIEKEKLVLDLSHGGERTTLDAIAAASRPMSIDHTGSKALADHPRNVTDAAIRAVADKGGVVGIYFMPFLTPDRTPTRDDVIAHIEHAVRIAGEDHVAIGTDNNLPALPYDEAAREATRQDYLKRLAAGIAAPGEGPGFFPAVPDYNSPLRFHRLAEDLAKRGWSSAKIEKITGGNWLRLWAEVWGA